MWFGSAEPAAHASSPASAECKALAAAPGGEGCKARLAVGGHARLELAQLAWLVSFCGQFEMKKARNGTFPIICSIEMAMPW